MSRTIKGSKKPGYEYWSKRPMSGWSPSRWVKAVTNRIERRKANAETKKEQSND